MLSFARRTFLKKTSQAGIVSLTGVWSFAEPIFGMAGNTDKPLQNTKPPMEQVIALGETRILKTDYGPLNFGWVVGGNVVSWSGKDSKDLLISRCWSGLFLYPTSNLEDEELNIEPMRVVPSLVTMTMGHPVDWNKDGHDDLIISDRRGFLYFLERKGSYPDIAFDGLEVFRDQSQGLQFNIPWENPHHDTVNDLGGYIDTSFFNYLYPIYYPDAESNKINLIIGDSAGNLWWLPEMSDGTGKPEYRGVKYHKADGSEYVKPGEKICDEHGEPYLLGEGIDFPKVFRGGNTRPVLYRNDVTGSLDLLVLAGMKNSRLYYLKKISESTNGKPVFQNLGEIEVDWPGSGVHDITGYHSKTMIHNSDGWNDIMLSDWYNIVLLKNKRLSCAKPEFEFDRWISGKNVPTGGYNFTEILTDVKGRRYLLDIPWHLPLQLREIRTHDGELTVSSERIRIQDQFGVFHPEGETDPQSGKDGGFHRASRWDFDGSGRQHLIVGTDKGLLYLLIEEEKLGTGGEYKYRSVGPLKDTEGNVIRIHNRAVAGGIDLNGDGIEDLVVGGVTYQLGFRYDPNPGGGFYSIINRGLDEEGVPILEKAKPLKIKGHEFNIILNRHVHIKTVDFGDGDGRQIILAEQRDGFKARVFQPIRGETGLEYTGKMVAALSIQDSLLDIYGDGKLKFVYGGGETGIAYYRELRF